MTNWKELEGAQDKFDEDYAEERPEPKEWGTGRVTKREILIGHGGKKSLVWRWLRFKSSQVVVEFLSLKIFRIWLGKTVSKLI